MALIICHECGKKISDTSDICIHCGAPLNKGNAVETKEALNEKPENNKIEESSEQLPRFDLLKKEKQRGKKQNAGGEKQCLVEVVHKI